LTAEEISVVSLAVAVLSAAIALLSVFYARRSANTAKDANKIAVHHERLKIYKALLAHVSALSAKGVAVRQDEIWQFYEPATLSKFYFDRDHADRMLTIFDDSVKMVIKKEEWEEFRNVDQDVYQRLVVETHTLHRATRDSAKKLAEEIEPALVISSA
jgi:hypothetical protein